MSVGEVAACCPTTELQERLDQIAVQMTLARKAIIALELERRVIEDTLARRNGGGGA